MPAFDSTAVAWVTIAILAAIVEISIPHFGVIFVSLAAIGGVLASLLGFGIPVQIAAFIVVLGVSWAFLRRRRRHRPGGDTRMMTFVLFAIALFLIAQKHLEALGQIATGADKLVFMPYEASAVLASVGGIRELLSAQAPPK